MIALRLTLFPSEEELTTAALFSHETLGFQVEAEGDEIVFLAYFAADPMPALAEALPVGVRVARAAVAEVDWVERFRGSFHRQLVGSFEIVPTWEIPARHTGHLLVVDPGRAFGTGTHESTRLCLRTLEELPRPLGRVLDIGTGTGILGVAAFLLGGGPVVGVDLEGEAIASARRHAELNSVALHVVQGDGARPFVRATFDLVVANLTTSLLLEKRDEIVSLLAPRGVAIVSGFLLEDLPRLRDAYSPLGAVTCRSEGEWAALLVELS
jgi:ribosomal protein L11 methyltransferase